MEDDQDRELGRLLRKVAPKPDPGFFTRLTALLSQHASKRRMHGKWRLGRKRNAAFAGVAMALIAVVLAGLLDNGSSGPSVRAQQNAAPPRGSDLAAVVFVDALHGWAVGDSGNIVATQDGGATWRAQTSTTTQRLAGVAFVDKLRGWVVGDFGTILATTDGGATWHEQFPQAGTRVQLVAVAFPDSLHGWAVGGSTRGVLLSTSDGGVSWNTQHLGTPQYLNGVSFPDPLSGWIIGDFGTLFETSDGGTVWREQNLALASTTQQNPSLQRLVDSTCVRFVDSSHGWVVGDFGSVQATTDGGVTWQVQDSTTDKALLSASFTDTSYGWAVGDSGTIVATTNGGATWYRQLSGTTKDLHGVWFTDRTRGWAVGEGGIILATTDGGASWILQRGTASK
jgi:photosystem II stability/assembly factor-like uncharacterized protein